MKRRVLTFVTLFTVVAAYAQHAVEHRIPVDFTTSMKQTVRFTNDAAHSWAWQQAQHLYETNYINNFDYSLEPRIPKIIHQVWLGSPFPERCKQLRDTWLKHHPDWEYMLWTEKEIEELGLTNKDLYDAQQNYGAKSDVARYEILYRFGGLYVDTDFECLKPFDVLNHSCDFYAGLNCGPGFSILTGLIASRAGHPILEVCIKGLQNPNKLGDKADNTILERTGPTYVTRTIEKLFSELNDRVVFFPTSYFYPWPHFMRNQKSRREIEAWIRPETFAIHHWHVSWLKK